MSSFAKPGTAPNPCTTYPETLSKTSMPCCTTAPPCIQCTASCTTPLSYGLRHPYALNSITARRDLVHVFIEMMLSYMKKPISET